MPKHRTDLTRGVKLPSTWVNALMEFVGTQVSRNFRIEPVSGTTIKVPAGTGEDQVSVAVDGRWRWATADVTAAHPGGAAGSFDVYVTAYENDLTAIDPADATNYAFGLVIRAAGSPPPASGATALSVKVGEVDWDGSAITRIRAKHYRGIWIPDVGPIDRQVHMPTDEPAVTTLTTIATVTVNAPWAGAVYECLYTGGVFMQLSSAGGANGGVRFTYELDGGNVYPSVPSNTSSFLERIYGGDNTGDTSHANGFTVVCPSAGAHTIRVRAEMVDAQFALVRAYRRLVAECRY